MLSIEACRKILGKTKKELTDKEIEEIRELLYQMATVLIRKRHQHLFYFHCNMRTYFSIYVKEQN